MMNRILIAANMLLLAAVIFLFYRVSQVEAPHDVENHEEAAEEQVRPAPPVKKLEEGRTPTGKFAYVNIDRMNEESLEIIDLIAESKRRKTAIESSVESLSQEYQKRVEEFQASQKAGIAPESDLRAKAREIEKIEKEAQDKQMQMERLTMDINDKNLEFQKNVKEYISKWNEGRYDFILSLSDAVPSMLLGNPSLEVTDEIISGLNNEYKSRKNKKSK